MDEISECYSKTELELGMTKSRQDLKETELGCDMTEDQTRFKKYRTKISQDYNETGRKSNKTLDEEQRSVKDIMHIDQD